MLSFRLSSLTGRGCWLCEGMLEGNLVLGGGEGVAAGILLMIMWLLGDNKIAIKNGWIISHAQSSILITVLPPTIDARCYNTTSMSNLTKNSIKNEIKIINAQQMNASIQLVEPTSALRGKLEEASENKRQQLNATSQLIKNIQKIEVERKRKEEDNAKGKHIDNNRHIRLNLMKLKDKSFNLDKNIYNIAIGEVASRESYLSNLQEQIETLKAKIYQLQEEEVERMANRNINDNNKIQHIHISHQHKKPICGRIYSKESSPIFNRTSTPKHQRPSSPKNTDMSTSNKNYKKTIILAESPQLRVSLPLKQDSNDKKNKTQQLIRDIQPSNYNKAKQHVDAVDSQIKIRAISNYRIKQKNNKLTIDDHFEHIEIAHSAQQQAKRTKQIKIIDRYNLRGQLRQSQHLKQSIQQQITFNENEQPEQQKQIFVDFPQWEIKSINDDFRLKITQQLQIPLGFPIDHPDQTDPLEILERKAAEVYSIFNIDVRKCRNKLVVRKFKNGVYCQLRPNKNIVWYFNGSFYLGEWNNQLPAEEEKNGFGFEYVPNKYYYLGRFSRGSRSGRGAIRLIANNSNQLVMAYDGEWFNGKPHGFGKHIDQKGNKYIGNFENGVKSGKAVILSKDGIHYQGEIKNGLKHGKGIERLVNGDVFIGDFQMGSFNGKGTYQWKNGSTFEGKFLMGKREGKGVWTSCNGDQFEGEYHNDLKHGWGRFIWKNGQIYEGNFKDDIREGQGYYKHPKGKVGKYFWKGGHIDHRLEDEKGKEQQKHTTQQ